MSSPVSQQRDLTYQACIAYIRYLEDCVAKLQARNSRSKLATTTPPQDCIALATTARELHDISINSAICDGGQENENMETGSSETHLPEDKSTPPQSYQ